MKNAIMQDLWDRSFHVIPQHLEHTTPVVLVLRGGKTDKKRKTEQENVSKSYGPRRL